jgi:RHS repeat-associated protein
VKKVVPSTGETTVFIYDASGKLVAEYSTLVTPQQDAKVSYLTTDHLGSPRINTDQNGAVRARHDYQPFGEEIQRASYGADAVRQQFTSYERDNETDLDYAKARMFGSSLGRFTSPDDFRNDTRTSDPSSWNLYVYVRNNPLKYIDPNGMYVWGDSLGGNQTDDQLNQTRNGRRIVKRRNQIRNAINTAQGLTLETARQRGLTDAEFAQIQRAAAAYGAAPGQAGSNNGVTVEFGNVAGNPVAAVNWGRDANNNVQAFREITDANDSVTGIQANLVVTFESISVDTVVHEGSHLADRQALASEFYQEAYVNRNANYDPANSALNLTQYQTENRAFTAESHYVRYRQGETAVWQNAWAAQGVNTAEQRQNAINTILRNNYRDSQNRPITPQNDGDRFFRWQRRQ